MLPIRFAHPEHLFLLLLLPVVWWIARASLAGLSPVRRRVALLLRILGVLLLVLALARLEWRGASDDVSVYFLLDWSDSIPSNPDNFRRDALAFMKEACERDGRKSDDTAGIIYFGQGPTCETPPVPGPPSMNRQAVINANGTDIGAAVRLALSTFPPGSRKRIVLATDGNQTRGDAVAEIEAARAQGVVVDVYPIRYSHERELAAEKLVLPDSIQEGVAFKLTAVIRSTLSTDANIRILRGEKTVKVFRKTLRPGRNIFPVAIREIARKDALLAGVVDYEVRVEPLRTEDDRIPHNNSVSGFTRLQGPPSILYVDGNIGLVENYHPLLHQALTRELRLLTRRIPGATEDAPEIRLHLRDINTIPDDDKLVGYDCIILDNVPAQMLGANRMERIRSLVNDQGTGLIMIGGEKSFGAGHYLRTPIEEALPVEMDLKNKKIHPNGALAIILHTCEFPNGNTWGKRITKKAIERLGDLDYVGVLLWDYQSQNNNGYRWLFPMTPAAKRVSLMQKVDGASPGDMPDFDTTIKMAVKGLQSVRAAVRHIILISDGDPSPPSAAVQNAILKDKTVTLSAIAIGSHSTPVTLRNLATRVGGGRFYNVTNPNKLPDIFIKESMVVKRSLLFEKPFTPALVGNANTEFVEPILNTAVPQLHGYVATTAKSMADVPLVSTNENKDPILAHWRYGLGQAVAWTSDAKNRWSKDWLGWSRFAKFWSHIVWRILREQPSNLRMTTEIDGNRGTVVVHALDKDGNPLSNLDLIAYVSDPEVESLEPIRMRQVGISTYEADFPAHLVGKYQIAVRKAPGSTGPSAAAYGGASVPFSAEMESLEADEPFLRRLAEKGAGQYLDDTTQDAYTPFNRAGLPDARDYKDLWRLLLALAAILFPLDVFVRRVMIDYVEIYQKARSRFTNWRKPPAPKEERMQRLMDVKEKARQAQSHEPAPPAPELHLSDTPMELRDKPAGTATRPATKPTTAQPAPETSAPAEEETYTSRLLKAKRRARGRKKE